MKIEREIRKGGEEREDRRQIKIDTKQVKVTAERFYFGWLGGGGKGEAVEEGLISAGSVPGSGT